MLTVGRKNFLCLYCESSSHLVFHSSIISLSTIALVSHQCFGIYLVTFCPFAPSLAAWSASSLPTIPTCALIQASFTVSHLSFRLFRAILAFLTVCDFILELLSAVSAACESDRILTW